MRLVLPLLLLLLPACGDATAEYSGTSDDAAAPTEVPDAPGVRVETAIIQPSGAALRLNLPGEVEGSRDALLASAQGGFVESVHAKSGQKVKKGQAIARVNTRTFAAQRDQAKARLQQAQDNLRRLETLGDLGAAAQIDAARTELAVAEAALDLAQVQVSRSVITAPFSGTVAQVDLEVGEVAAPGSPVARVVQLDPVHVSVSISDKDISALKTGMKVSVNADARGAPLPGTIIHIDPAADLRTRTFTAEIEVENPDHKLLPGMIATVSLDEQVAEDTLVLPQDWLVTRLDGVGVFLADAEGRARWQPVVPGLIVGDQVVISSGLEAGQRIVITGHRALADGDPLIIAREGTCCTNGRVSF